MRHDRDAYDPRFLPIVEAGETDPDDCPPDYPDDYDRNEPDDDYYPDEVCDRYFDGR